MYNPALDIFIAVADLGSFTKAAGQFYLSPTAVMKQINALEQHLEVKLFDRTISCILFHLKMTMQVFYLKLENWEKNLTF